MNISERLKAFTDSSHQRLEKSIVSLIRSLETEQDYIHLLGLFYSYFRGIEFLLEEQNLGIDLPDFKERRKALFISEDMLVLHGRIPAIIQQEYLPEIKNSFQAFGALYVIEGSTLGGVHIVKMIQKKLPDNKGGYRFFSGYGDQTLPMWNRFKVTLNNLTDNEEEIISILTGAEDTFHKFGEWVNFNEHAAC